MQITKCEPAARPNLKFDSNQFSVRRQQPVEAHYARLPDGSMGFVSTGISFDDYSRCQTSRTNHGVGSERRLPVPDYALDDKKLRTVIVRFLEIRSGLHKKQPGTLEERLARVSARLKERTERQSSMVDRLCAAYVACTDLRQRRFMEINIRGLDTTIRIAREPWVIPQVVRMYYRERLNAKIISETLCLNHDWVRQLLYRLEILSRKIEEGTDVVTTTMWDQRLRSQNRRPPQTREQRRACVNARLNRRKKAGLCLKCGKNPSSEGRLWCQTCASHYSTLAKKRRAKANAGKVA